MDNCVDYRLVCRTCLASEAEFYKLDAKIFVEDDDEKVSFLECLKFCTKLEDIPEYPIYICTECSTALQVAYNFMKNALEAHDILRQKLCLLPPPPARVNGQLASSCSTEETVERKVSFRCKICGEKVETKRSLKEHVKLHLDIITYTCEVCEYQTKKRSSLNEHYIVTHGLLATKEQLKAKTIQPSEPEQNSCVNEVIQTVTNPFELQTQQVSHQLSTPLTHHITPHITQKLPTQVAPRMTPHITPLMTQHITPQITQQITPPQPMNVAQFLASSTTDLHQVPLNMATVIAEPSTSNARIEIGANLQTYGHELNLENELSVGNEFVVMQDGTVQEVMSNGMVINYINTSEGTVTLDNGIFINNLMIQPNEVNMNENVDMVNSVVQHTDDMVNITEPDALQPIEEGETLKMDIDDIIVEDNAEDLDSEANSSAVATFDEVIPKQIRCKMCTSTFLTQEELKEHMLTHNEIPHFFCEICKFYTFFKIDLTQHYKTKHSTQPNNRQLQPKNKVNYNLPEGAKKVFVCEMCIYDTPVKAILRRHYLSKHLIEATEMQLRPMKVTPTVTEPETDEDNLSKLSATTSTSLAANINIVKRDFPQGIYCTICNEVFYWEDKLKNHYKEHKIAALAAAKSKAPLTKSKQLSTTAVTPTVPGLVEVPCRTQNPTSNRTLSPTPNPTPNPTPPNPTPNPTPPNPTPIPTSFPDEDLNVDVEKLIACTELTTTYEPPPPASIRNEIPADAIPQVVETDSIVDNILDFDFNGDAIFEDDSEENDDTELQDYVLTTDDEQEYVKEISRSNYEYVGETQKNVYCVQCNKKFAVYYQFENHMFVHRGLAPYRCEMCTNLYNTKRDLIRHYQAVHKILPTRDMIQAKGEKVPTADQEAKQMLNASKTNVSGFMCAKCPYEATEFEEMIGHLGVIHGVEDDNFILQKLPHECPKCIRSFDTNSRLTRHLERNHSSNSICHAKKDKNDNVSCKRCGLELPLTELNAHEAFCRIRITTYECLICELEFNTRRQFSFHKNKYHPNDTLRKSSQQLTCKFCHNKYRSEFALKHHLRRHNSRKHSCELCPKTFVTKSELINHATTHTGEYPHECDMCHKVFRYTQHLKRHKLKVHTLRRFVCEANDCNQRFLSANELEMHLPVHRLQDFPNTYQCQYCTELFYTKELLRFHAKSIHQAVLVEEDLDGNLQNDSNEKT